jgi:hypothetical protein
MSAPENPGDDNRPDDAGPPDFVFEDKTAAVAEKRNSSEKCRVRKKRVDGNQYWVCEKCVGSESVGGANVEVWRDDL